MISRDLCIADDEIAETAQKSAHIDACLSLIAILAHDQSPSLGDRTVLASNELRPIAGLGVTRDLYGRNRIDGQASIKAFATANELAYRENRCRASSINSGTKSMPCGSSDRPRFAATR